MCIRIELDEGLQRAWITVLAEPQTTTVAETIVRLTNQRPLLGGWDWVIDIRNPHTKATPEEIDTIAAAFNAATSKLSYTIFISDDPATYDRCALLGRKFYYRAHLVARSVAQAKSLLPETIRTI